MKVGIFSPYLETMGGGERYLLTVAEFFQNRGDEVHVFWDTKSDKLKLSRLFNLKLDNVKFVSDVFFDHKTVPQKLLATTKYDLMFFLSDGSIPSTLARKNILHFQRPFNLPNQKTVLNKIKLSRFNAIVCNSKFTKKAVDATYGVNSLVLYPPVDTTSFVRAKKENIILSVGRFFAPSHPKKQEVLIKAFSKMVERGLVNYRFVLIGGITGDSKASVQKLTAQIKNLPITIITDATFSQLQAYYAKAKFFWHAAGYGENLAKTPERAEHFGITTVEAMSAGAVPIVFAAGGQLEIVEENQSGMFWQTPSELIAKTTELIANERLRITLANNAVDRAKAFSKEKFYQHLNEII